MRRPVVLEEREVGCRAAAMSAALVRVGYLIDLQDRRSVTGSVPSSDDESGSTLFLV
jgi:hypothetical protein